MPEKQIAEHDTFHDKRVQIYEAQAAAALEILADKSQPIETKYLKQVGGDMLEWYRFLAVYDDFRPSLFDKAEVVHEKWEAALPSMVTEADYHKKDVITLSAYKKSLKELVVYINKEVIDDY